MPRTVYLCRAGATDPHANIALERALLEWCPEGAEVLLLWRNEPTVVIGRNQDAASECDLAALAADGTHLARRLSGGGAVYHDLGNLNYSFLARGGDGAARWRGVVARALESLGLDVSFEGRNDFEVGSRKCSGTAGFRTATGTCWHGTVLVGVDLARMGHSLTPSAAKLAGHAVASTAARVVNLAELLPGLTVADVARSLAACAGPDPRPVDPAVAGPELIASLRDALASEAWLLEGRSPTLAKGVTAHG